MLCSLVCVGALVGCSQLTTHIANREPYGVWRIRVLKTSHFQEGEDPFLGPLVGGKIYSYKEGVAELFLRSGERARGYVFVNNEGGTVEFFFNERVNEMLERVYLPCVFQDDGRLVAEDGKDTITLKRTGSTSGELPSVLRSKLASRQDGRTRLDTLLKEAKNHVNPSSDGKAYLPGVQGDRR